MRNLVRMFVLLVVCAMMGGCITSTTLVKVKTDGSGTIEQTLSMRQEAADDLQKMMGSFAGANAASTKPMELFGEADMRAAAGRLGEGVSFVSSRAITAPDRVGRIAVYSFTDITKVHVEEKPATPGPVGAGMPMPASSGRSEAIRFGMTQLPNGHALLTVSFPEAKPKPAEAEVKPAGKTTSGAPPPSPEQMAMIKRMFDGLKINVAVEPQGTLVKTNSPYVAANRVTLLEMDFTELLNNDAVLQQIGQPGSLEDAKAILKSIKGFKVNLDKEVTVEFAGQ
jgi:hypothetical protein